MSSLLNLPITFIDQLLKKLDQESLFVLRKVCSGLRNYIEHVQPDYNINAIRIVVHLRKIQVWYNGDIDNSIFYEQGCLVRKGKQETLLENEDFIKICVDDMRVILSQRTHVLSFFSLYLKFDCPEITGYSEQLQEGLHQILKSRKTPIKVRNMELSALGQEEMLLFLPFFELSGISLYSSIGRTGDEPLDLSEIEKLDQWKLASRVHISNVNSVSIPSFSHFQKVSARFPSVSFNDLAVLEEMFIRNPTLQVFKFYYQEFDKNRLLEHLGEPQRGRPHHHLFGHWHIRIPRSQQVIHILSSFCHRRLTFSRKNLSEVPIGFDVLN
ncbi:hypothetical protein GCK72_020706 [Caenorhabditis remanei]|uniref:F-box domain-containing protein n=1 Tax=Caenorhabditis remanei TaxID=31234 RepID=A0A6A5GHK2_CAERE|nr:hypothetical protein GCK72_020706 [Caenorhabditis remanei]KAF1754146.1 hypothetical protein GCK72_020706 [Caenorhabditis remanei]